MASGLSLKRYRYYVDGGWRDPASGQHFETLNPFTGAAWALIPRCDSRDVDAAVEAAHRACVTNPMRIAREEVFGPILSVITFRDDEEAYAIANDSPYGLASGVWTTSIKRALTASRRLRTGSVWINTYRAVSFIMPFGGFKSSGIGRENGKHAIDEYLETKSVWMSFAEDVPNPFVMR